MIYLEEHFWRPIQSVYLSMLCALVFIAAYLFLPETKGQPLPATVEETAHNTAPPPAVEGVDEARFIIRTGWRTLRYRFEAIAGLAKRCKERIIRLMRLCRRDDEPEYTRLKSEENDIDE